MAFKNLLFPVSLLVAAGCATSESAPSSSSSDVIGVTDLSQLETEFGLVKDDLAHGAWTRSDEQLKAGKCYDPKLQYRRYKQGAAFFVKKDGNKFAAGDKRPVLCVDIDAADGSVVSLTGFTLDSALRYHLGSPTGYQGAAGTEYLTFQNGYMTVADPSRYCGFRVAPNAVTDEPAINVAIEAYNACRSGGAPEDTCYQKALDACEGAATADAARETVDRPAAGGDYIYSVHLGAPSANAEAPAPELMMLVYKFASAHAAGTNAYSMKDDPFGALTSWGPNLAFAALGAARTVGDGKEVLSIAPIGSPNPLAQCTRPVDGKGSPTADFECWGF